MVGHIRYEWISSIMYRRKTSWLTEETIRILYKDAEKITWMLELVFRKGTDVEFIANDILRKASKYRLEMVDEKGEKEVEFFNTYSGGGRITPTDDPKNKLSAIRFPNSYFAPKGEGNRPNW